MKIRLPDDPRKLVAAPVFALCLLAILFSPSPVDYGAVCLGILLGVALQRVFGT
jgi:hypothetical protein